MFRIDKHAMKRVFVRNIGEGLQLDNLLEVNSKKYIRNFFKN